MNNLQKTNKPKYLFVSNVSKREEREKAQSRTKTLL